MTDRQTARSYWSILSLAMIGFLLLTLVAACGSDDDDDDAGTSSTATTATGSSGTTSTTAADTGTAATGGMVQAMAVGTCVQEETSADVVNDLRDGNTDSAEGIYRDCLSDALPPAMVSQLDPIIEQAGTCGSDAAAALSDEDVAAVEGGDQTVIQKLTTDTLDCLSADLGIDLQ